jgi:hypothetical protein
MTTGCDGSLGDATGSCVALCLLSTLMGAGSRTVERRRAASDGLASTGAGSGAGGGVSRRGASATCSAAR